MSRNLAWRKRISISREPFFDPKHFQVLILQISTSHQTCAKANSQEALQLHQTIHQFWGHQLVKDWKVYFTYMPIQKTKHHWPLTFVDIFPERIKAFLISRETIDVVALELLEYNIPWLACQRPSKWNTTQPSLPESLSILSEVLNCSWKVNISDCQQSLRKIEMPNGFIKNSSLKPTLNKFRLSWAFLFSLSLSIYQQPHAFLEI